jgi:hypothetical protein
VVTEDKNTDRPQPEEAPDKDSPVAVEQMYIPDYVMLDFGVPLERKPAGAHPSNSVG